MRLLFQRRRLEADLEDEIRFHLEMKAQDNRATGMTPEQADHAARRRFGNATLAREASREFWGWVWLDHLAQDLHYALRALRANPGFTAVAVLTLALGIGANTAVFTLINAVILRTLPVKNPHELVLLHIREARNGANRDIFSYPLYKDLRDRNEVLSGLLGHFRPGHRNGRLAPARRRDHAPSADTITASP
ncbi:MAG: permease prefix domain 1-containing protein [Acidobacteriota bacterium]